ncbi:MAG: nuclear transport factor 2 family protein [Marmoricola sp.]
MTRARAPETTQVSEQPSRRAPSPQDRVDRWLALFESALSSRDVERAAALFATESYWRDLVSFTWNLTTVEGRDGVTELLGGTLETTDPSGFATEEPPGEADGVVTAWIVFETAVGRGRGLLRLKAEDGEDRAWTLLTTLYELKGHEEPRGTHRPMGAEHGATKGRVTWKEKRQDEAESLGSTTQPYVLVVGGGQGGIALGARLRQLGVPSLVIDKAHPSRRPVAQPLQVALPARPRLVRPPALPEVPRQLAGVLAQGQDR